MEQVQFQYDTHSGNKYNSKFIFFLI